MPTAITANTPTRVAATGTWVELTYAAGCRGLVVQSLDGPGYLRFGGVAEGAAIGNDYLQIPAGATLSHWLPGTSQGAHPRVGTGSVFVAGAAGVLQQIEILS